jgi:menaquinone-dependent protoporphyrinogen oxidase
MKMLIAYASTEGQTRKIASQIAAQVRESGHDVHLEDIARRPSNLQARDFEAVIIAASVHQEKHQEDIETFVASSRSVLATRPTMFLSVSLAAAFEDTRGDAERYIASFTTNSGWKPDSSLAVAGALRSDEYDYYQQQILEHVVLKDHKIINVERDYEFTDWKALTEAVNAFLKTI